MKRDLAALAATRWDALVVGGGIYGAFAAWDAAQRGLRVALVEARDFGGGTSWNSLKTLHGGLRHLQRGELGLLRESVRERRALLRIAPELVRPLPFLVPSYGHGRRGREVLAAGLLLHALLSPDANRGLSRARRLPGPRLLSRRALLARLPGLPLAGLNGAVEWHDAQLQSGERLLLAVLHAASAAGAALANRAELVGLRREAGRVTGAELRDAESGAALQLEARVVINAAGPGAAAVWRMAGVERPAPPLLRGVNLVLRQPLAAGAAVGAALDGRYLFLVPWRGLTLAGTAYADPATSAEALAARFRDELARAFPWAGIATAPLALVHDGLVPGDARALGSRSLVRDHAADGVPGLVTALGAKYTTARAVAERAVDAACRSLGRRPPACRTHRTPLPGARLSQDDLAQQARHAVREEMARDLEDVVLRRLELGARGRPDPAQLAEVAEAAGRELGWDASRRQRALAALEARWGVAGHVECADV